MAYIVTRQRKEYLEQVTRERLCEVLTRQHRDPVSAGEYCSRWHVEESGIYGEATISTYVTGRYDPPARGKTDIEPCIEARGSFHSDAHLRITKRDSLAKKYALAVQIEMRNGVAVWAPAGWLWGYECKEKRWWRADYNEWWVPQNALRSPRLLLGGPMPGLVA